MIKQVNEDNISEKRLKNVQEQVNVFCKIAYQLYSKMNATEIESNDVKTLYPEPPDEFTNAA